jgi:hypothetical protein
MKRSTFFISSTIHDFLDLRSALKFYLEEQGCRVLASEYNDFTKPLDQHSYEACLSAIGDADYFILLIGTRVGGWYDEGARISISQREYREAYQLQQSGKLKLLNFVRASVWQVREDHRTFHRVNRLCRTRILECRSARAALGHRWAFDRQMGGYRVHRVVSALSSGLPMVLRTQFATMIGARHVP